MFAAVHFEVDADASPGLLPRLLQPFARRDLVPDDLHAVHVDGTVTVRIGMHAMPKEMVHLVEGNLWQVVGVRDVVRAYNTPLPNAALNAA